MLITIVGMIIEKENVAAMKRGGGLPMYQLASPQERKRVTEVQGSMTEIVLMTRTRWVWCHNLVLTRCLEEESVDHNTDFGWET